MRHLNNNNAFPFFAGNQPPGKVSNKKTDWLVGRDQSNSEESVVKSNEVSKLQKITGVRRSESVKVTSKYPLRDRFRQEVKVQEGNSGAISTQKSETSNSSSSSAASSFSSSSESAPSPCNKDAPAKDENPPAKTTGKVDPPWKNVTLRRTESAKLPNYTRSKPLTWKRDEQTKNDESSSGENDKIEDKNIPSGWRPVSMEMKNDSLKPETEVDRLKTNTGLRRSESARSVNSNRDIVSKFLTGALQKDKELSMPEKCKSVREITRLKDEENIGIKSSLSKQDSNKAEENNNEPKLGRSQSMRLLFERQGGSPTATKETEKVKEEEETKPSYLARSNIGVRRTSSLKITEKEAGAFRSKRQENGVYLDLAPMVSNILI